MTTQGQSFLDSSFLTIQKQANADAVLFDVNIEDEHRIVLNPSNDLEAGTTYVVRSPSGTFQNGNNLPIQITLCSPSPPPSLFSFLLPTFPLAMPSLQIATFVSLFLAITMD